MYIFTFLLFLFFAFYDIFGYNKKAYTLMLFSVIAWFIFHDGFRWGIATDWEVYRTYFEECLDYEISFELGYVWANQLIRSVTDNYSVFLILHAVTIYLLISRTIIKYSPYPFFSFFLLYCTMLSYLGMNRQYIAVAICFFSIKFILDRNFWKFLLCIILAVFFHSSALLFILAYFLTKKFETRYYVVILGVAIIISILGIINKFPLEIFFLVGDNIGDKAEFYGNNKLVDVSIISALLGILKRIMWIALALFFDDRIKFKNNYYFFFNLYVVGTVLYILFNNTVLQVVVSRGIIYYNLAEIIILPYLITIFKDNLSRKIIFLLIAIYSFFVIEKGMNFYKMDLGYDIYRPYNSVLIDPNYNAYD